MSNWSRTRQTCRYTLSRITYEAARSVVLKPWSQTHKYDMTTMSCLYDNQTNEPCGEIKRQFS